MAQALLALSSVRDFQNVSGNDFSKFIVDLRQSNERYLRNLSELDYEQYQCFISEQGNSGYALSHRSNAQGSHELANVFSILTGTGRYAVQDAIKKQPLLWLSCYCGLMDFYSRFGFKVVKTEKNWHAGGPDVLYMSTNTQETITP